MLSPPKKLDGGVERSGHELYRSRQVSFADACAVAAHERRRAVALASEPLRFVGWSKTLILNIIDLHDNLVIYIAHAN